MNSVITYRSRKFSSPNYTCIGVKCTSVQQTTCRNFSKGLTESNIPFSTVRMANSFFRLPSMNLTHEDKIKHGTFCSELVTEILQAGDILPKSIQAKYVTPSELARTLLKNGFEKITVASPTVVNNKSTAIGLKGNQVAIQQKSDPLAFKF